MATEGTIPFCARVNLVEACLVAVRCGQHLSLQTGLIAGLQRKAKREAKKGMRSGIARAAVGGTTLLEDAVEREKAVPFAALPVVQCCLIDRSLLAEKLAGRKAGPPFSPTF